MFRAAPLLLGRVGGDQWLLLGSWAKLMPKSGCSFHDGGFGVGWRTVSAHITALRPLPFSISAFSHFLPSHSPPLCLDPKLLLHARPQALASPSCMPSLALLDDRASREPVAPVPYPSCHSLKLHPWVTRHGAEPLPSEDENCTLVEVTEEEVENSVKHIPSLATVVRRAGPPTKSWS